jgi:hypothetical protein
MEIEETVNSACLAVGLGAAIVMAPLVFPITIPFTLGITAYGIYYLIGDWLENESSDTDDDEELEWTRFSEWMDPAGIELDKRLDKTSQTLKKIRSLAGRSARATETGFENMVRYFLDEILKVPLI